MKYIGTLLLRGASATEIAGEAEFDVCPTKYWLCRAPFRALIAIDRCSDGGEWGRKTQVADLRQVAALSGIFGAHRPEW